MTDDNVYNTDGSRVDDEPFNLHMQIAAYLEELKLKSEKLYNKILDMIPGSLDTKESVRKAVDEALKSILAVEVSEIPGKVKSSIKSYMQSKGIYDDKRFDRVIGKLSVHALLSPSDMVAEIKLAVLDFDKSIQSNQAIVDDLMDTQEVDAL